MQFSSNQSVVRTGDRYLTSLLQPAKSHVIICTQPIAQIGWCTLFVATHRLLNCAMHPLHCAKVDVRTHFRKGYMRRELAIQHFRQKRCHQHTAPPLFLTWHGVARPRDTRRLSPVPVSLTLLLDHHRRARPILNGLKHRTCAPTSFQHIVAPLTYTGAQQNLPVCSYERLQA